jgi:hypothetical protein
VQRRSFIAALCGALAWPLSARAQAKPARIGLVMRPAILARADEVIE